jgi:hypothetical protein
MSYNVPAVTDVFAVAIKETVGFQQPQKCGGTKSCRGRKPEHGFVEPAVGAVTVLLYEVPPYSIFSIYFFPVALS